MRRLSTAHELLDGPLDADVLEGNLRDLARVNKWLGGAGLTWRAIQPLLAAHTATTPFRVLDVGTGAGDIPRELLRRAGNRRVAMVATEIRPELVEAAGRWEASPSLEVRLQRGDLVIDAADGEFDVVHASMVLHHVEPHNAVALVGEMRRVAARAVIVNDLDRRRIWWHAARLMSRTLTRNPYTRHDAPLSVLRAYRPDEVAEMAHRAGLREIARYWARPKYRYAIVFEPVQR